MQSKVIADELYLSAKCTCPLLETQATLVFMMALGMCAIFLHLKSERTSGVEVREQGWKWRWQRGRTVWNCSQDRSTTNSLQFLLCCIFRFSSSLSDITEAKAYIYITMLIIHLISICITFHVNQHNNLITAMLFHHFIKSSQWEQWNRCVSVRGKHYSSLCWHILFLNHLPQTLRSINCWKWGRGSREISVVTKREYM